MKNIVFSIVLSAIVAYGVSSKVVRNARLDQALAVAEQIDDAVEDVKATDRFRAEQFADLNARCYFHSGQIDDIEHMAVGNSKEIRAAQKDISDIIKILTSMRNRK